LSVCDGWGVLMSHLDDLFAGYPTHLSVVQLTELLGIQRSTAYKWLSDGTIPAYRVGSTWVILRDEVKDRVSSGRNLPPEPGGGTVDT
jgi:excisionase family DNA binding protein